MRTRRRSASAHARALLQRRRRGRGQVASPGRQDKTCAMRRTRARRGWSVNAVGRRP